jgi:hypothetical protein
MKLKDYPFNPQLLKGAKIRCVWKNAYYKITRVAGVEEEPVLYLKRLPNPPNDEGCNSCTTCNQLDLLELIEG